MRKALLLSGLVLACQEPPPPPMSARDSASVQAFQEYALGRERSDTLEQRIGAAGRSSYALPVDLSSYGLELASHEPGVNGQYVDIYESHDAILSIVIYNKQKLEDLFPTFLSGWMMLANRAVTATLKPGESFRIIGEGAPVSLSTPEGSALRGGAEFWLSPSGKPLGPYTDKYTVHGVLIDGEIGVGILYRQGPKDSTYEKLFDEIVQGIR